MEILKIQSKASSASSFKSSSSVQDEATQPSKLKEQSKASLRKFMSESTLATLKIRQEIAGEIPLDHYDSIIKDLQEIVNLEECKRALKDLNEKIKNFDRDLEDPKLTSFERELEIYLKPTLYQKRSALNFLLGNLEEALADEWTCQSLDCKNLEHVIPLYFKCPIYTYRSVLNDHLKCSTIFGGIGSLLFDEEEKGIDLLNLTASAGGSLAVLLLLALGKSLPEPMDCYRQEILEEPTFETANEKVFAHLKELFQNQKYQQVIEETDLFLKEASLDSWEGRFFFQIRGAAKAILNDLTGAIRDYDQAGNHHEWWLIEKALVKILAGDRTGAKADLQLVPATRGYPHGKAPLSHEFATYDFNPWKTRAMMIEKLFDL